MNTVFFDYNSTTPIDPAVLKVINHINTEIYGNPSSLHEQGREARKIINCSRQQIASLIGASEREIYFTSGGTESNNWAIKGIAPLKERGKNHIISSVTEHSSVFETLLFMEKEGWNITWLPVDTTGKVDPEELRDSIRDETALISIMSANNETGTIQNLEAISSIAGDKEILLHSDAVQGAGKMPLDVNHPKVDLMSLSSHKIYGPKGVGALFIRKGVSLPPLLHGGGQENKRRSGTENVAAIAGFGEACRLSQERLDQDTKQLMHLKQVLYNGLSEKIKYIKLNGSLEDSLPNTLNVSFPGCESETLVLDLDSQGFAVSAGSACGSIGSRKSRVLKAMGLKPAEIFSAVRLSLGRATTVEEVQDLIKTLSHIVEQFV